MRKEVAKSKVAQRRPMIRNSSHWKAKKRVHGTPLSGSTYHHCAMFHHETNCTITFNLPSTVIIDNLSSTNGPFRRIIGDKKSLKNQPFFASRTKLHLSCTCAQAERQFWNLFGCPTLRCNCYLNCSKGMDLFNLVN